LCAFLDPYVAFIRLYTLYVWNRLQPDEPLLRLDHKSAVKGAWISNTSSGSQQLLASRCSYSFYVWNLKGILLNTGDLVERVAAIRIDSYKLIMIVGSTLQIWEAIDGRKPLCTIELIEKFKELTLLEDSLLITNESTVLFLQLCVNSKPIKVITVSPTTQKEHSIMPYELMNFAMEISHVHHPSMIYSEQLADGRDCKIFVLFSINRDSGEENQDLKKNLQSLPRRDIKTVTNSFQGYQILLEQSSDISRDKVQTEIKTRVQKIPFGTAVIFAQNWHHLNRALKNLTLIQLKDIWNKQ